MKNPPTWRLAGTSGAIRNNNTGSKTSLESRNWESSESYERTTPHLTNDNSTR